MGTWTVAQKYAYYERHYTRGYKLCRCTPDGRLLSIYMADRYASEYRIGRWTRPRKDYGPLAVLADLSKLHEFCVDWLHGLRSPALLLEVYFAPSAEKIMHLSPAAEAVSHHHPRTLSSAIETTVLAERVFPVSLVSRKVLEYHGVPRSYQAYQQYIASRCRPHAFHPWEAQGDASLNYTNFCDIVEQYTERHMLEEAL